MRTPSTTRTRRLLPPVLAPATLCAPAGRAQDGRARAQIDAAETRAPISPQADGQFPEHADDLVNDVLWAETLDDRTFHHPVVGVEPASATGGRSERRRMTVGR